MPRKKYVVDLLEEERASLLQRIKSGEHGARKLNRARILLLANEGKSDREIAEALHTGQSTVQRTRQRFVEGNLEGALNEWVRPRQKNLRPFTYPKITYEMALLKAKIRVKRGCCLRFFRLQLDKGMLVVRGKRKKQRVAYLVGGYSMLLLIGSLAGATIRVPFFGL